MDNVGQDKEELVGSLRENQFVNLEYRRDRQHTPSVVVESYHTERTKQNHSKSRSHASHDLETRKLQQEIDCLRNKLRRREHKGKSPSPPPIDGSRGSRDTSYHHQLRTPSSESYSVSSRKDKWEKSSHDYFDVDSLSSSSEGRVGSWE
nr:hypothetical protein CFP56_18245 [Quercus suber]